MHTNMDSSENEHLKRGNENRPSVIYFHGLSETDNILAANRTAVKRYSNLQDEDFTSKSELKLDADTEICARG